MHKRGWIYIWAVTAIFVVLLTNWLSVYLLANSHSLLLNILLVITHSGDALSVALIVLLFIIVISKRVRQYKSKFLTIIVLTFFLLCTLGGLALLNEHMFKTTFSIERPSIEILKNQADFNSNKMYQLQGKSLKRGYLKEFLNNNEDVRLVYNGKKIEKSILKLWRYEVGYSFPSGHATNAFLLAVLVCYLLSYLGYANGSFVYGAIYLWASLVALSRVLLGVHSPLDISFGAIWGTLIGILFIKAGVIKSVFFNKRVEKI